MSGGRKTQVAETARARQEWPVKDRKNKAGREADQEGGTELQKVLGFHNNMIQEMAEISSSPCVLGMGKGLSPNLPFNPVQLGSSSGSPQQGHSANPAWYSPQLKGHCPSDWKMTQPLPVA